MRNSQGRVTALLRAAACALLALGLATPAAAQFGGLKKKLKAASGQETAAEGQKAQVGSDGAGPAAPAMADAAGGGSVVLTPDVVDKLVAGLKAADAVRQSARKENTPYGRYQQERTAYEAAKPKCEAGKQSYPNRVAGDEKLQAKAQVYLDKMIAAQTKGDTAGTRIWSDSVSWLMDPSCVVKEPVQPNNYYDTQREVDSRAEKTAIKTSGLSPAEWAMGLERGEAILRGNPPPDASASEKSAVNARAGELKPLLGIHDAAPERARKEAPAPQPAPAPAVSPAAVSPGTAAMNDCMTKNAMKHQKEIEALGERAKAAQEAGDMDRTLAIADTLRQLQMAGCTAGQ